MYADNNSAFALIVEDHPLVADSLIACIRGCNPDLALATAETCSARHGSCRSGARRY
jgi:hypothetical protein